MEGKFGFMGWIENSTGGFFIASMRKNCDFWLMKKNYVDIFQYEDFRKFLKDYQINRKKADGDFTLAKISVLCGSPNNRGYYGEIINGKTLSLIYTEKMVKILKLKYNEAMYFRLLVHCDRSIDADERGYFKKKLDEIRKKKSS